MATAALTIPAGQSVSNATSLASSEVTALIAPPGWTQGIRLAFLLSPDNTSFYPMSELDSDLIFTIPVVPGSWMPVASTLFPKNVWLKIQAGDPSAPVTQTSNQVFTLVTV